MSHTVGDKVYSGIATYGRIRSWYGAIIGTIAGICMIGIGIYILKNVSKATGRAGAVVLGDSKCVTDHNSDGSSTLSCTTTIGFKQCSSDVTIPTGSSRYTTGQTIQIEFDPSSPCTTAKTVDEEEMTKLVGQGLIIGAIVIMLISWITTVLSMKYKGFAAAEGTVGAMGAAFGRGNLL